MKEKGFIISCKQASLLSEMKNDGKLGFWAKIRLRLHLLSCSACRKFIQQSQLIGQQLKNFAEKIGSSPKFPLSEDSKRRMEEQIKQGLKN